ncbi:YncE family protein [Mesorhizobium sp. 2RAF45]|uniref:YncE family protein n=1 Tax=Mesorhizobium sp. 2RAF45 TaxID=3233001 RepID=UPI003F985A1C
MWLLFLPLALCISSGSRADDNVLHIGDIAASGFAGVTLQAAGLPPGVDPATKTVIDPDGVTLQILDASQIQQPVRDQQIALPARKTFKAREIGHVFGLAFDNLPPDMHGSPGLYAAATSAFGLQIVGPDKDNDGKPDRLTTGAPGAKFMDGLFGPATGGGGGAIWKIDAATGTLKLYAQIATNTGQGIGGIAFDPVSRSIYVSDLDTGLIHQYVGNTATHVAQFDHGLKGRPMAGQEAIPDDGSTITLDSPNFDPTKPETWGMTPVGRRIEALAVHSGRLFYATAGDHSIWSIGLGPDGSFQDDARIEFGAGDPSSDVVGSIVFDGEGAIIAFRNEILNKGDFSAFAKPGASAVLRYVLETPDDPNTPSKWTLEAATYPVGQNEEHADTSGGAALQYAYKPDGTLDTASCSGTLVVSGDALGPQKIIHGVQIGPEDQWGTAPDPDLDAGFIAIDPNQDVEGMRGHAGGVAALTNCDSSSGFPPVADANQAIPPVQDQNFPPVAQGGNGQPMPPVDNGGNQTFPPVDNGSNQPFPPVDQANAPGTLSITKSAGVAKCNPKGGCAFNIDVTNNGGEVAGPIVINELIEAPQATLTGEPNAPWQCTKAAPFTCTHPGPVPANGKLSMRVVFAPNTAPDVKEIKNCAALPGAVAPQAPIQQGQNQQPAVALPPPVASNAGGLAVTSTPTGGSCSPTQGTCEFAVTVTNSGPVPITGPLTINETLAVGSQSQAKNDASSILKPGGMVCTPNGRELNCQEPNVTLAPGESRVVKASFKVDTVEGGAAQFVQNHAVVSFGPLAGEAKAAVAFEDNNQLPEPAGPPAGQAAQGGEQAAQQACASIPLDPNAPFQKGPVVISKKGPASCPLVGPCTFEITLTNTTDAAVPGPIPFTDTLDIPGAKLSDAPIPAPFSCVKGGPPLNCTLGNGAQGLGPHESKTLPLTFDLDLPDGTTSLKNCAVKPAAPAAPVAPKKKAMLLKPSGNNPPMSYASFRPGSFAGGGGLLHFVADPGGNIGGVNAVSKDCTAWRPTNGKSSGFNIQQSDHLSVAFAPLNVDLGGNVTGSATFIEDNGPVSGNVSGKMSGNTFNIDVAWSNGSSGHYQGTIDDDGKVRGRIRARATDGSGHVLSFQNNGGPWFKCTSSKFCQAYADEAVRSMTNLGHEGCQPAGPAQRWTLDRQKHIDFCMAQGSAANPTLDAEKQARSDLLAQCKANSQKAADDKAKLNDTLCDDFAQEKVATFGMISQMDCAAKAGIPAVLDAAAIKQECMTKTPLASQDELGKLKEPMRAIVAACFAEVKAKGGVLPPEVGGGGAGVEPGADAAAGDPAPEQCAVVDIAKPDQQAAQPDVQGPPPVEQVPPPVEAANANGPPQDQGNGLTVQKSAGAADCTAGQLCVFNIQVTSKTPNHPGPIVVKDTPDNLAGLNLPANKPFVATPPSWVCTNGDTITCTNPGPVPPEGLALQLSFAPGAKATAKTFRNCASIDTKPGPNDGNLAPEPSCAEVTLNPAVAPPPAKGAKLTLKKIADDCKLNDGKSRFECNFSITITNAGDAPFKGPITINEAMPGLDGLGAGVASIPPWTCIGPDPLNPVANSCNNRDASIDAQASISLPLAVTIPRDAKGLPCQLDNTATLEAGDPAQAPAKATATMQGVIPDPANQGKCKLPAQPNLVVKKSVATAGGAKPMSCTVSGQCSFDIVVRNLGDAPFTGPINLTEAVQERLPEKMDFTPSQSPGWSCSGVTSLKCDHPVVTIQPGGRLVDSLRINVTPGAATWKKDNTLTNCAALAIPPGAKGLGNDPGTVVSDDKGCAFVALDPFSVKVTKTGDQSCLAGSDCHFQIRLFNPGPIDHNAPVTISDKLTGFASAPIVSINPPLPCAAQPTQIPFSCTSPGPVRLDLDAADGSEFGPKTFDMIVRLPADAAPGSFSNCADVSDGTAKASTGRSCVSVQAKPAPPATTADLVITKTAVAQTCGEAKPCDFKITVTNKSAQAYPAGISIFDLMAADAAPMTQYKFASSPAAPWVCIGSAAPGMQCNHPGPLTAGASVDLLLSLQPLPGSLGDAKFVNNCANIDGQQAAAKSCAQIAVEKPAPSAQCRNGMTMTGGICACPANTKWNGLQCAGQGTGGATPSISNDTPAPLATTQPAECKFGMTLNNNGFCACPAGTKWNGGACVAGSAGGGGAYPSKPIDTEPAPVVRAKTCPVDRPLGNYPNCCPAGTSFKNGVCKRAAVAPPLCSQGMVHDRSTGKCVSCPTGTTARRDACVKITLKVCPPDRPNGTYPNCCPSGTELDRHGRCRPPKQIQVCADNQFFDPDTGLCVKRPSQPAVCPAGRPVGTYPNCCPTGTHFVGRRCVRDQEQQQQPPRQITCPDGRVVTSYAMCRIGRHTQPQPQEPRQITCPDGRLVTSYAMCRIGRHTQPQTQVHDCPSGYKVLTKPSKYGAYCEIIPVTPPPPPPAQGCPAGYFEMNGKCLPRSNVN